MAITRTYSLWNPVNALAWLALACFRQIGKLPLPLLQKIGSGLGLFAWYVAPYRKSVGAKNLKACFPDMSESERNAILKAHFASVGMGFFELAAAWYGSPEKLQKFVEYEGLEHFLEAISSDKGALILTGHFTPMELTGRFLIWHAPFSCLFREPNQPVFAAEMNRLRLAEMNEVIHFNEISDMVKSLRRGEVIWYTPDQGRQIKQSELSPFFGEPCITNAVTGRLAKMGRASVIPFFGFRKPDGSYKVKILPPETDWHLKTPQEVADRTNEIVEAFVMEAPEQYFWLHRRFKRRGEGLPNLYKDA